MLLAHYEKARSLAKFGSPQRFAEMEKRYGKWQVFLGLAGLVGILLLFFGDRLFGQSSRFLTVLLPTLLVAAFFIGGQVLRAKQDILTLAKRLQNEAPPPK